MPVKSTNDHYGSVAVIIHWLTALLLFATLVSGIRAANIEDLSVKAQLLAAHTPLAIVVVLLTLARILWWLFADKKPCLVVK